MKESITKSIGLALEPSQREKDRARWFEGKVLNIVASISGITVMRNACEFTSAVYK